MRISSLWLIAVLALTQVSCSGRAGWRTLEGAVWATTYHITYRSSQQLDDSIIAVMSAVEASLSPFAGGSAVSRVNRGETDCVDSLFAAVFRRSAEVSAVSGGLFDPTVAPAVNLWRFGYRDSGREPTESEVDSVRRLVGIGECRIADGRIVRKSEGTEFDFSAITKGYGCDLIGEMLRRNGCDDYMIEIGGEIVMAGHNRQGEDWRIMIDAPTDTVAHQRLAVVSLTDCGVATSGNYRNYRDTERGRIGHTINPLTCMPATGSTLSATVVAPDCMTADALATACMAMTADAAVDMIEAWNGASAMIVTAGTNGGLDIYLTDGFPELK